MPYTTTLKSIASYLPQKCVPNAYFESFLETNDAWITQRTGIKTRYFAEKSELSSDLGFKAADIALKRANLAPKDIDLLLCATLSPDFFGMPSTACIIASKLGITDVPAFDVVAACTGFIYLLSVAKSYIESGMYRNILLVCAEKSSAVLDFQDRGTCILFGDGAGALVVSRGEFVESSLDSKDLKSGIKDVHIGANGDFASLLYTPRLSLDSNVLDSSALQNSQKMIMKGNEVFKIAVRTIANEAKNILESNGLSVENIAYFIPHQANIRIIDSVAKSLNFPREKLILTVQKYGNTGAASIPMAICDAMQEGKFKKGDLLLLDSFGSGFTWGSALIYADFV
ncbi:beta-ketoacyl-ACP synthase III [Helicobacter saguini]|uniref:Beta-ketoacyl-[acyl-carrier-protein] synthase III n=1 Tax=Helicobacter saguini TaxID=1548018 RepID=A0A347VPW8_9HELI|nr:beta-ketoacyl-ACP synthase III [Helicobacter saguini]MWV61181.1 beta-ketoacyl-ACP synthase III [Helicobacter saguini]MWV68152.1 beta-ketoacyl-ACP synthase III [Helicobacter saguini]MWV70385.1 beta-ketoacyl-ACP synthase III [Helicobacter saguini]MWV72286.1 beta-ketoacyl-ACP synthase III [Helicobacter saguini]TLD95325.1 ketoacyl-ACP synthase III [Helicobacter saguini]